MIIITGETDDYFDNVCAVIYLSSATTISNLYTVYSDVFIMIKYSTNNITVVLINPLIKSNGCNEVYSYLTNHYKYTRYHSPVFSEQLRQNN